MVTLVHMEWEKRRFVLKDEVSSLSALVGPKP